MLQPTKVKDVLEEIRTQGLEPFIIKDPMQIKLLGDLLTSQTKHTLQLEMVKNLLTQLVWNSGQGVLKEVQGGSDVIAAKATFDLHDQSEETGRLHSIRIVTTVTSLKGFVELDGHQISFYGADLATAHAAAVQVENDWFLSRYDTSNSKYTYEINFRPPRDYYNTIKIQLENVGTSANTLTKYRIVKEIRAPKLAPFGGAIPRPPEVTHEGKG